MSESLSPEALAKRLLALSLRLDAAMALTREAAVQRRIGESVAELNSVVEELRTAALAAQDVGDAGIRGQLTRLAIGAGTRLGCTPKIVFTGTVDSIGPAVLADVVAVAGEMLANVVRHSYAGAIEMTLAVDDSGVSLTVRDDGVGPNDGPTSGRGLADMQARAQVHGGTFAIEANTGEGNYGSTQRWSVPTP